MTMKISQLLSKTSKTQLNIYKKRKKILGLNQRFKIIEISTEILDEFMNIPYRKNETLATAFRELTLRASHTLQAVTLLSTAGMGIQTISLLRDLIEIEFLLQYFLIKPKEITKWWQADRLTRIKKYTPNKLRIEIGKKYPKMKEAMDADYIGHCEIASHPTPISLRLQNQVKNNTLSPSTDFSFAWVSLFEVAFHAERLAKLVAFIALRIKHDSLIKEKIQKLEKLSSSLDPSERKIAVHLLGHKVAKS